MACPTRGGIAVVQGETPGVAPNKKEHTEGPSPAAAKEKGVHRRQMHNNKYYTASLWIQEGARTHTE